MGSARGWRAKTSDAPVSTVASAITTRPWLVMIGGIALLVFAILVSRTPSPEVDATISVRVSGGETLWSLAAEHPVSGLDTAQTADLIARLNGLKGSTIAVGSSLHVPVSTAKDTNAVAMR